MRVVICGSMEFAGKMLAIKQSLESGGHTCVAPVGTGEYSSGVRSSSGGSEGANRKIHGNLIKNYFAEIARSDAVLVLNYTKKGVANYVGGNTFLEMGFAHVLNRKIFLMNEIPDIFWCHEEILAMQPVVINGDLTKIV